MKDIVATKPINKHNKNLIIGICCGALILAITIVTIIFAIKDNTTLNDAYFISDDTKYVITIDGEDLTLDDSIEYPPTKTHVVYYHTDDVVTGVTTYLEYTDEVTAKAALKTYEDSDQPGIKSISTNGKYLVIVIAIDQYSDTLIPSQPEK